MRVPVFVSRLFLAAFLCASPDVSLAATEPRPPADVAAVGCDAGHSWFEAGGAIVVDRRY